MIQRQTGATLCAVPRCPNKLGSNPYRYCLEHLPAEYRKRAERYIDKGDPRKARVAIGQRLRSETQKVLLKIMADGADWNRTEIRKRTKRFSNDAINKALSSLVAEGKLLKLKLGVYRLDQPDAPAPVLLSRSGARAAILSALAEGTKSTSELRRIAPASYSTFRDSIEGLVRQRQVKRVAVGVFACAK
jgi:hypothetical protein